MNFGYKEAYARRRQRQKGLCDFKASLDNIENSGQQGYMVRPCPNNNDNMNNYNSTPPTDWEKKTHNHRLKKNTTKTPSSLYSKTHSSPPNKEDSELHFQWQHSEYLVFFPLSFLLGAKYFDKHSCFQTDRLKNKTKNYYSVPRELVSRH